MGRIYDFGEREERTLQGTRMRVGTGWRDLPVETRGLVVQQLTSGAQLRASAGRALGALRATAAPERVLVDNPVLSLGPERAIQLREGQTAWQYLQETTVHVYFFPVASRLYKGESFTPELLKKRVPASLPISMTTDKLMDLYVWRFFDISPASVIWVLKGLERADYPRLLREAYESGDTERMRDLVVQLDDSDMVTLREAGIANGDTIFVYKESKEILKALMDKSRRKMDREREAEMRRHYYGPETRHVRGMLTPSQERARAVTPGNPREVGRGARAVNLSNPRDPTRH